MQFLTSTVLTILTSPILVCDESIAFILPENWAPSSAICLLVFDALIFFLHYSHTYLLARRIRYIFHIFMMILCNIANYHICLQSEQNTNNYKMQLFLFFSYITGIPEFTMYVFTTDTCTITKRYVFLNL